MMVGLYRPWFHRWFMYKFCCDHFRILYNRNLFLHKIRNGHFHKEVPTDDRPLSFEKTKFQKSFEEVFL